MVFNRFSTSGGVRGREICPADLLTSRKFDDLNYWIPRFVNEARRADGCAYPPRTINQLLTGLQHYMLGSLEALRSYEKISVSQNQEVSKMFSQSVAVKCDSQQMFRSLGGINHCSIGNITFNIGNQQAASE